MTPEEEQRFRRLVARVFDAMGSEDFVFMIPTPWGVCVFSSMSMEWAQKTAEAGYAGMTGIKPEQAAMIDAHRAEFMGVKKH